MQYPSYLVDQFGDPVTATPETREYAPGFGRAIDSLDLRPEINPDTIAAEKGLDVYDITGRDPHIYGITQIRRLSVACQERTIEPYSDKRTFQRQADFIRWNLEERLGAPSLATTKASGLSSELSSWQRVIYDLTNAYKNGYALLELLWEQQHDGPYAGKWVVANIKERDPDRFFFRRDGIYLRNYVGSQQGTKQPRFKYLHYAFDSEFANPYGTPLYNKLFWLEKFKRRCLTYWMTYMEKFSMPGMVGRYPSDLIGSKRDTAIRFLQTAINEFRAKVGVTLPDNLPVDIVETSKTSTDVYWQFCQFADRAASKAVLGNELFTGAEDTGSYGLAKATSSPIRQTQLQKDCQDIDDVINFQLIEPLLYFNFPGLPYACAYQKTHYEEEEELNSRVLRDEKLLAMGLTYPEDYLREVYGVPVPEDPLAQIPSGASPMALPAQTEPTSVSGSSKDETPPSPIPE